MSASDMDIAADLYRKFYKSSIQIPFDKMQNRHDFIAWQTCHNKLTDDQQKEVTLRYQQVVAEESFLLGDRDE